MPHLPYYLMVSGPQIYIFRMCDSQSLPHNSGPSFQQLNTHLTQQMHSLAQQGLSFRQQLGIRRTPAALRCTHLCIRSVLTHQGTPELGDPNPSCKSRKAPARISPSSKASSLPHCRPCSITGRERKGLNVEKRMEKVTYCRGLPQTTD